MKTRAEKEHVFPLRLRVKGETLVFRRLNQDCGQPMIDFARALPAEDLLFLERDITQQAEVDRWIKDVVEGRSVTIVAWRGDKMVGYATFVLGRAPWTRHVAEVRVVVGESDRGIGVGRLLLQLVFEMALEQGATKVVARMTPDQTGAQSLFKRLGFVEEAVLRARSSRRRAAAWWGTSWSSPF
jgi:L-amino acid N-acyltransferase YncA